MVIRIHGHHLLLGLRLNNYHNTPQTLYPRQLESVKSGKKIDMTMYYPQNQVSEIFIVER